MATGLLAIGQVHAQAVPEPATAPAAGAPAAQTPPRVKLDKNGKVCQYEEVTGSRMKKRVCHTPEHWEARERAAKETVRELDGKPLGTDANGG